jgi:Kdo2-lipid IVA lauroyltransferase/acyltransferase
VKYRPKHIVEYAALRVVAAVVVLLPYRAALVLGWAIARLSFAILRSRVREAERRIALVFGDRFAPRERRRIAWISWRNIVFSAVEMIRLGHMSREWLHKVTNSATSLEVAKARAATGEGAVLSIPHTGSWELAGAACRREGLPVFSIVGTQRNPLVNVYMNAQRRAPGIERIERGAGTMRAVLRALKKGGFLVILPDVRMRTPGLPVPFLGGMANLGDGMARFARQAGVPIYPGHVLRRGWARHELYIGEPLWPDPALSKEEDVLRLTREVIRQVDALIHAEPEQWFWFNKRWVLDPVATPTEVCLDSVRVDSSGSSEQSGE